MNKHGASIPLGASIGLFHSEQPLVVTDRCVGEGLIEGMDRTRGSFGMNTSAAM